MIREIRTQDLRFTPQETAAYLSQKPLIHVSRRSCTCWKNASKAGRPVCTWRRFPCVPPAARNPFLSALSSANANITGYLVDEVLSHQFPAIHAFLLKTSILNRFCASLCEAILGETDGAGNVRACLDWIEYSELFIIPLDNRRVWYRYHHLFQELLQQRLAAELAPDQVAHLHRRASAWFEEQGLLDEALHHALAAGDLDLAARQMTAGLRDVSTGRTGRPWSAGCACCRKS